MPTYVYRCKKGHTFELFHSISDDAPKRCPTCRSGATRVPSGGSGLLFKGSGFYITDYRSSGYKESAKQETGGKSDKAPSTAPSTAPSAAPSTAPAASGGGSAPPPPNSSGDSSGGSSSARPSGASGGASDGASGRVSDRSSGRVSDRSSGRSSGGSPDRSSRSPRKPGK